MNLFSNVPSALKLLLPLAAGAALAGTIAIGASDNGGGGTDRPLAQVQQTATPVVEGKATNAAIRFGTPRPQVQKPVQPVTAAQAGRNDCPADWLAWREVPKGRFSICYPQTLADWH